MKLVFKQKPKKRIVSKGGSGSGHHGHAGRPGKRGGSAPGKGGGGGGGDKITPAKKVRMSDLEEYGADLSEAKWDKKEDALKDVQMSGEGLSNYIQDGKFGVDVFSDEFDEDEIDDVLENDSSGAKYYWDVHYSSPVEP